MSFTVFSYNATVLLIQPKPTQPMSISALPCCTISVGPWFAHSYLQVDWRCPEAGQARRPRRSEGGREPAGGPGVQGKVVGGRVLAGGRRAHLLVSGTGVVLLQGPRVRLAVRIAVHAEPQEPVIVVQHRPPPKTPFTATSIIFFIHLFWLRQDGP